MRPIDRLARRAARSTGAVLVAVCASSCDAVKVLTDSVATVEIAGVPESLAVGAVSTLSAVARSAGGKALEDKDVQWASRDTAIVQVDGFGNVRARVPGTARIIAVSEDKLKEITIVVPQGPAVAFNTFVTDDLSVNDDADEFTFTAGAGQLVNVFLQGLSGASAHQFRLRLIGPGGNVLDSLASRGNDAGERAQALRWRALPEQGTYRVRIDANLGADPGGYKFMVESVNPAPETAPAAVTPGTPVTAESLSPGDIDTFTFNGTLNEEISVLFLAKSGKSEDVLKLFVYAPTGSEMVFIHSNGDYTAFQPSGRMRLEQTGTYTVRVEGEALTDGGAYEFRVLRINRAPEAGLIPVTPNAQVGEAISPPGDVDEFTLRLTSVQELNVYLQPTTVASTDTVVLRVLDAAGTTLSSVTAIGRPAALETRAISHLGLYAATFRIQVEGGKSTQGAYRFLVRPINLAPERAAAAYSMGAIVSTDSISPVGDVDQYTFRGTAGHRIGISFRATSGSSNDVLRLRLVLPTGGEHVFVQATGSQNEQNFTTTLPQTGDYRIRIQGVNSSDDGGPYRFQLVRIP